ncbi:MAG TPA: hypothetical protein VG246_10385 [Acidimicrobiales bacterium]|jgi:YHS domain-containing protein|nr:hypothetical protein [Acidimicrobiales bacterium]
MAIDPVCGAEVNPALVNQAAGSVPGGAAETDPKMGTKAFVDGAWVYFCSLECRSRFVNAE